MNIKEIVKKSKKGVFIDLKPNNNELIISFGGVGGTWLMPPFEFFNITRSLNKNKLFFRDIKQTWYHQGIKEIKLKITLTDQSNNQKILEKIINYE